MKSIKNLPCATLFIAVFLLCSIHTHAQCRGFAKKQAVPLLGDYTPNGRLYMTLMESGQNAELVIVLNGGQQYRIVNCIDDKLGKVAWTMEDENGNVVFNNRDHDMAKAWDFEVKSTQEFIIKTNIPEGKRSTSGCSVVLVGYKKSNLDALVD